MDFSPVSGTYTRLLAGAADQFGLTMQFGRTMQASKWSNTVVFREIETAVPDERILVLFVPYILLAISYNTKVNLFGLNEVKIEIDSPGAGL